MLVINGPAWHKAEPVAVSDTVDNIGGTAGARAVSIHNRSGSAVLAYVMLDTGDTVVGRINSGGDWSGGGLARGDLLGLLGHVVDVAVVLAFRHVELVTGDVRVEEYVSDVEERRLVQADVYERRLHARKHTRDATLVDVTDDAPVFFSLEIKLSDVALLDQRDTGLPTRGVDDENAAHG